MKSYIYVLFFCFISFLTGCDNSGEEIDSGYFTLGVSYLTEGISDNYVVKFDGEEVTNKSLLYIKRKDAEGLLEVFKKGSTEPELSQKMTIDSDNQEIRLILTKGEKIDIYKKENYTTFNLNISYSGSDDLYEALFNGVKLNKNGENYIKTEDGLTGNLQIYKDGIESPVFSQEMTILENGTTAISLLQLSDLEFLSVPADDESAPESNRYTKLRFFYTSDVLPGVERIKIIIYEWTNFTELGSVEMEVSQLSAYQTIDWNLVGNGGGLCQDIIDLTNGEPGVKIVDSMTNFDAAITIDPNRYKFATARLGTGGIVIAGVNALCTSW